MMPQYKPYYRDRWALIIGINQYRNVQPLNHACNDADSIHSALINNLGFSPSNVVLLKDSAATSQAIRQEFHAFGRKAQNPDDCIFVFFAGHGYTLEGMHGEVGFLVPVDGDVKDTSSLIRWDDLTRNCEILLAKHILFAMDACYSGLALQRATPPGTKRFLNDMLQRQARQVITAGKGDQTVSDGGSSNGKNSIFTGYLLDGLSGKADDENGILTGSGLMNYVYRKVGQDPHSKQTPSYGYFDGDGDFIFRTSENVHLLPTHSDYAVTSVSQSSELPNTSTPINGKPSYSVRNGYGDPDYPRFGVNDWTENLGERRSIEKSEIVKAYSWLSLIVEPVSVNPLSINLAEVSREFLQALPSSPEPYRQFRRYFESRRTSIDSVVFFDTLPGQKEWRQFLRVEQNGNLEFATSEKLYMNFGEVRTFHYVSMIGYIWQFMFFAKEILNKFDYRAGVNYIVNLVGTKNTHLSEFASEPDENNQFWSDPLNSRNLYIYGMPSACISQNLQMKYAIVLESLGESESFQVVQDVARKLTLAYNHQSEPRCFNYNTKIFPWRQFANSQRY